MFFPLPPPASPSLLEAIGGMAARASARISVSFGGSGGGGSSSMDKGKGKERDMGMEGDREVGCVRERDDLREKEQENQRAGPWNLKNIKGKKPNLPSSLSSLKKKESRTSFKLGSLLSRLSSPTSPIFKSSPSTPTCTSRPPYPSHPHPQPHASHSSRGHSHGHPTPPLSPVLHITAPTTSPVDSCVSLVFTSDGEEEDEDEDGINGSPAVPLTPLEPSFGLGQSASAVMIEQPEVQLADQTRNQGVLDDAGNGGYAVVGPPGKEKEEDKERELRNRLLRVRSFRRSPSKSHPSLLGVLDSLDYSARNGGSRNGLSPSPSPSTSPSSPSLSPIHARRRRVSPPVQMYPPPFSPLPTPPQSSHHLSPPTTPSLSRSPSRSPPSSSSSSPSPSPAPAPTDWTLALPLLAQRPSALSLKREHAKDAEYKRRREEQRRREDWTLGLDSAWSSGALLVRARGSSVGSSKSRSRSRVRQHRETTTTTAVYSPLRIVRPSSPFPLLDGSRNQKVSLTVVDEDEHVDVCAGGSGGHQSGSTSAGGEMERALQALLSDAGESLRVEDKTMTSSSREPWSSASSSHSDSLSEGIEWSVPRSLMASPKGWGSHQYLRSAAADRSSVISGTYYSARSSWQSVLQTAVETCPA